MVDFLQLSPISRMHLWSSATVIFGSLLSSSPIAQFGRTASSRKGSGRPKRLPFKDYGGHCALRNLKCSRNFFVTLARSVPCHNSVSELASGSSFDLMILICSDMHCEL